jgi:molybdopterin-guanine dinucleotide biosynthesis protein A
MSEAERMVGRREPPPGVGLGAILAGGRSSRFGSPKTFVDVAGLPMLLRVRSALAAAVRDVVAVGHDPLLSAAGLECRPDLRPGGGPMAGLQVALLWARERGLPGVLLAGCDMPFLSADLLRLIVERAAAAPFAVAPVGSMGGSPEPLCTWYSVECLPEVDQRLDRGQLAMRELLSLPGVAQISPSEVRRFGDPSTLFMNVNTMADRERAEVLARQLSL